MAEQTYVTTRVNDLVEHLEGLVDAQKDGLLHVLTALEIMCGEKSDHIAYHWQDQTTAKVWDTARKRVGKLAREIEKLGI